jgi:hypothetical protein
LTKWVVNTFGNNVYQGNMPMAQGFAPVATIAAKITTTINGTCVATITAKKQDGVTSKTWTVTLDNLTAGTLINMAPTTGGDRAYSTVSAIAISGTANAGAFDTVTVDERTP